MNESPPALVPPDPRLAVLAALDRLIRDRIANPDRMRRAVRVAAILLAFTPSLGCVPAIAGAAYYRAHDHATRLCKCPSCSLSWNQDSDTVPSHYRDGNRFTGNECSGIGASCR